MKKQQKRVVEVAPFLLFLQQQSRLIQTNATTGDLTAIFSTIATATGNQSPRPEKGQISRPETVFISILFLTFARRNHSTAINTNILQSWQSTIHLFRI